ncbi:DUF2911 domain-containing protein [Flavobacteriaceae bacterium S356]|uniref:DUF2911 domain-containing protein n=1 Tax=Asprobacillus argus TaxID=3076534 RepID=A0ABU3LDG4_9FLAO|nr:DUF2911 domain-containing protein [Flavobacteriaceae bacterium S356]
MKTIKINLVLCIFTMLLTHTNVAQNVTTPRASQLSTISQRSGLSDVTITYHSPGVKGRKVFGGIVRYNKMWRAGANENTTIQFTHDAKVEGKKIAAGTYGLFMKPNQNSVDIIFSKYSKSWGTIYPGPNDIALEVTVKSEAIPFQEWLSYDFINKGNKNIMAALSWEKTRVPFTIEFDITAIVVDNMRAELKGIPGFGWRGHMQAANFCLQNNINLEEAMVWIDKSIASSKGFSNLQVKAGLLAKKGKITEAEKIMEEAIPTGNPYQLNQYGYVLLNMGKTKKAIEVFSYNVEKNKNHQFIWGFLDSLGEAYLKSGDKKKALKHYKEARTKAPQNQHSYLDKVIAGIK